MTSVPVHPCPTTHGRECTTHSLRGCAARPHSIRPARFLRQTASICPPLSTPHLRCTMAGRAAGSSRLATVKAPPTSCQATPVTVRQTRRQLVPLRFLPRDCLGFEFALAHLLCCHVGCESVPGIQYHPKAQDRRRQRPSGANFRQVQLNRSQTPPCKVLGVTVSMCARRNLLKRSSIDALRFAANSTVCTQSITPFACQHIPLHLG